MLESQQLDIDNKPDGNSVSVLGSVVFSRVLFCKRAFLCILVDFFTRILFNLHNFGCSCRLRKEREEDKIQRLVQEEAVRFLWNQVNSFSPLIFCL